MRGHDLALSEGRSPHFSFEVGANRLGGLLEHHQARITLFLVRISIKIIFVGDLPLLMT